MPASLERHYAAKIARRARIDEQTSVDAELRTRDYIIDDLIAADYDGTLVGVFRNVDRIHLRWARPDWFEYIPDPEAPFSFTRPSGETIVPGRMLTDGGSIPRWFWAKQGLSPWCHVPAFLVHDWEFDLHHAGETLKTFEDVRDTMTEALKTLMETEVTPRSVNVFRMIYAGISSWIAKDLWAGHTANYRAVPPEPYDFDFITRGASDHITGDKRESGTNRPDEGLARPTCYFRAEMDREIQLDRNSTLTVTISREVLDEALDRASASGGSEVDREKKLIVDVRPRLNVRVVGDSRAELDVPEPHKPATRYFDLAPSALGPVKVTVTIRQGMVSLAQLDLAATALAERPATVERASNESKSVLNTPAGRMNQLRIFDSEVNGKLRFSYELSLPTITLESFESKEIKGSHTDYVDRLYRKIENHYRTSRTMPSAQQRDAFRMLLEAMGGQLCEELFPDRLRELLWTYRSRIDAIQVISTEPFVPWELVFLKDPKSASAEGMFLAELGLTRWVHGGWHPSKVSIREGHTKYVAPEYELPDNRLLEAPAEARFLEERLGAAPVTADFPSVMGLLQQGFDLLHFVCHGKAEQSNIANAELQLSCQLQGAWQTSSISALLVEQSARLKGPDGRQPMVVLNACQTGREGWQLTGTGGFAQAFLKAGAGIFVGTLWSVIDRPARVFVEALYEALLEGKMLGEAAREAREKTKGVEPSSWLAYAVYGDPYARLVKEP
jgi:hypothetical protein